MKNEMEEHNKSEFIDPRLVELLNQLRQTPERKPDAVERSQERFLTELDSISLPQVNKPAGERGVQGFGFWKIKHTLREEINKMSQNRRFALTITAVLVIGLVFLFGGSAMTVMASQSAIPGDTLYPVKTRLEQTRLSMAGDAATRAELQLEYAERRLEEMRGLAAEGRFQNIKSTTLEFEAHIQNALAEVDIVINQGDPARASQLMKRISDSLVQYGVVLAEMVNSVPEPVRADMEDTLQNIRQLSGNENFNGNMNDNGNANGNLNDNDSGNLNDNDNTNDSRNDNGNLNDNDNDNGNDNGNFNDNDNDNGDDDDDTNTNANGNTNTNTNANSNTNTNTNVNTNTNTNTNTNNNDNDDDNGNDDDNDNDDD